jgi:hypothetical protein
MVKEYESVFSLRGCMKSWVPYRKQIKNYSQVRDWWCRICNALNSAVVNGTYVKNHHPFPFPNVNCRWHKHSVTS